MPYVLSVMCLSFCSNYYGWRALPWSSASHDKWCEYDIACSNCKSILRPSNSLQWSHFFVWYSEAKKNTTIESNFPILSQFIWILFFIVIWLFGFFRVKKNSSYPFEKKRRWQWMANCSYISITIKNGDGCSTRLYCSNS